MPPLRLSSGRNRNSRRPAGENNNRSRSRQPRNRSVSIGPASGINRDGTRNAIISFNSRNYELSTSIYSTVNKGVVSSTSAAEGLYAFSFTLADVADYTNYTSIWDIYSIKEIVVTLIPVTLPSAPATGPAYAICYVAPDFDDATTPANTTSMLSYSSLAFLGPSDRYSFKFAPAVDIATTTSAAAGVTGVYNKRSPWLDCSSPSITHYGVKLAITQSTSTNLTQWIVMCRYHIDFKRQQ